MNDLAINKPQGQTIQLKPQDIIESFIISQDVKQNSKNLYRRTIKQFFSWVSQKDYKFSELARPQIIEYREDLLNHGNPNRKHKILHRARNGRNVKSNPANNTIIY